MMTGIIDTLLKTGYSPATFQRYQYDRLESIMAGSTDLVDATNPFVFTLEMGSELAAAALIRMETALTKVEKSTVESWEDLYRHMADVDYLNLFCTYAIGKFNIYFSKDEIYAKAVKVGDTGIRKLIIPKYTKIMVTGIPFMTLYPIEIRVMSHGGIQVVYDSTVQSVIRPLETNIVEWKQGTLLEVEMVNLPLQLVQLERKEFYDTLNPSVGFSKAYALTDNFYHCEVIGVSATGVETPFHTTHSELIYDKRENTALLRYSDNSLRVTIPRIYFSEGKLPPQIKIVIYTSRGAVNLDMDEYVSNAFSLEFGKGFTDISDSVYYTPFESWSVMGIAGDGKVNGGRPGLTFEEARKRSIENANRTTNPITEAQLRTNFEIDGFTIIRSIDNLMQRVYQATRHLPAVANSEFTSGAACMIGTLQTNMDLLATSSHTRDNGLRLTVTPDTLYKSENGVVTVVANVENPIYLGLGADSLAAAVNSTEFMYSPFHYVLDATGNSFECRAYYLGNARVTSRQFILENDTTQLNVATNKLSFVRKGDDWVLTIEVLSGENYQDLPIEKLFCQLSFVPDKENNPAFLNGVLKSVTEEGNAIWEFVIKTTLDIDSNDFLMVQNFSMFSDQVRDFGCPLTEKFNLIYGVSDYSIYGLAKSDIDLRLGRHLLPDEVVGIVQESLELKFGEALTNLWSNGRTVDSSVQYATYGEDVPYTYPETILETDPDTGLPKIWVDNGEIKYNVLIQKGDPLLDDDGQIVYKARASDVVYDESGLPIVVKPRQTDRQVDLFLVDGAYYFSNSVTDVAYRNTIADTVIDFLSTKLNSIKPQLHAKTELYFYPKKSLGQNKVIVGSNVVVEIPARLSFVVTYYMTKLNYGNLLLRESITKTTKRVINEALKEATVSIAGITDMLRVAIKNDVLSIEMAPMGPDKDISTFTAIDEATRCSVRRNLKVLSNASLAIEEAILVDFIAHKE